MHPSYSTSFTNIFNTLELKWSLFQYNEYYKQEQVINPSPLSHTHTHT